jgi:hypothetical protein
VYKLKCNYRDKSLCQAEQARIRFAHNAKRTLKNNDEDYKILLLSKKKQVVDRKKLILPKDEQEELV